MKINKIINVMLALILVLTMAGCAVDDPTATTPDATTEGTPSESTPAETTPVAGTPSESTPSTDEMTAPVIDYMSMDLSAYITLGKYKGLEFEIEPKDVVDDAYIKDVLDSDMIYYGYTEKVTDRAVTKEDTVSISFVGLLDGVAFEGGTGSKDNFTIYDGGGFIDGFADGLIGVMPGVETDLNLTFPEEYHSEDLAGKDVVFKVTVHHIYEAKELTDEITKEMTKNEFTTAAALLEYYEEYLTAMVDEEYNTMKSQLVWEKIYDGTTVIKSPDAVIDAIYEYEMWSISKSASMYGMDLFTYLTLSGYTQEQIRQDITDSVIQNMTLYAIVKAENFTITNEDYLKFIEDLGYTEDELLEEGYTKEELWDKILVTMLFNDATEWQTFTEKEAE